MFAQSSAIRAFALIALSFFLVAVSALPQASLPALRQWQNGTIGWNATSDSIPASFVTLTASPEPTSHLVDSTIATSSTLESSLTVPSSPPRLFLSASLSDVTIVMTSRESEAKSLAFGSRPATASITSSMQLSTSSPVDFTRARTSSEEKPTSPSSTSSPVMETSLVPSTASYVDATTITSVTRGYKPDSSSSGSSLTVTDDVTSSQLSGDNSIETMTIRGHTVLLLPGSTNSPTTTRHYASPTPWVDTNTTMQMPNRDKVKKIAGICIGSSVGAGILSFTIKKGVWMALEKAQTVHPDWSKSKVIDYLIRGSHSTDSSWSSESTDSSDFSDSTDSSDSSWIGFPSLTGIEGHALAQVEDFLIQEEVQNPGSVFEPEPAGQIRSVIGEHAWGQPYALSGPTLPTDLDRSKAKGKGKATGKNEATEKGKGPQKAAGSDESFEDKASWSSKTFDSKTATTNPQDAGSVTITTLIGGNTVLILPPGATRAPLHLPPVDQNTPWKVERSLVSNATVSDGNASNITGYTPPEDNSRALAASIVAPALGIPATFAVSWGIYKGIREWVYHDSAIKEAQEAEKLAEVMERMIRVQEKMPLSLDEGNEMAQIENFLMIRETYNPGGTYTKAEMNQIAKALGRSSTSFWKEATIEGLPKESEFLAKHGVSNVFGNHGMDEPEPRPWPKQWGPAPPGLSSEEPVQPDQPDPSEPPVDYTMSGGLGDPPPDDEVPPDAVHAGPPFGPWRWIPDSPAPDQPDPSEPPLDYTMSGGLGDPSPAADDGPDQDNDNDDEPTSTTPTARPRKSVHWQTPLTSIFPTAVRRPWWKGPGGGADDNKFSDPGSNDATPTNEPTSRFPTTEPKITQLGNLTGQNVTTTGLTTSPPLKPEGSTEHATRQSTSISTLTGSCTAADCRSSRRPTPTEHDSVRLHDLSSMHPECSSNDGHGTCLSSKQPTPTSHKSIWSLHVDLTNTPPTTTPLPRSTVVIHTMVTISVATGVVHPKVTVAPPAPPAPPLPPTPPPPPPSRPRRQLCGGDHWTDCCVYRYGRSDGMMDCFDGPLPHKHHMNPPCHDGKLTDCCIYRKGVAMRCSPTNLLG